MSIASDPVVEPLETKGRLLDVAERLFAEHGFDAVSLRAITAEAEANLAAVNYHFGSKEALIGAVFARQVEPVNRRRMELLDQIDPADEDGVQRIVEAFIGPVLEAAARGDEDENTFCKLMSRCMAARDDRITQLVMKQFPEVVARFVKAIRECFPSLTSDAAHLRLLFMGGAMAHALFHRDKIGLVSDGRCERPTLADLRDELAGFLAAGLAAPETGKGVAG